MDYKELMKDCVSYILNHREERHDSEGLGKIFSCKGEYLSWLFQCYYMESLESYLDRIYELPKIDFGGEVRQIFRNGVMQGTGVFGSDVSGWILSV